MLDPETLGRLIGNIGRPGFDSAFFELARRTLDISSCSAFAFEGSRDPCPVILEGHGSEQRLRTKMLGSAYVREGYRQDPQMLGLFEKSDIEVRIVNPSEISHSEFRGHYYDEPRISTEIAVLAQYRGKHYNIGFYRSAGKPNFGRADVDSARMLAQVALPALHRHMELLLADPDHNEHSSVDVTPARPTAQTLEHLGAVLLADGHGLSPREAQVCAAIILGYRTLAISLNLGISENTICTHRKRAYAKLGISSQNELFSRYFRTVTRLNGSGHRSVEQRQIELAS